MSTAAGQRWREVDKAVGGVLPWVLWDIIETYEAYHPVLLFHTGAPALQCSTHDTRRQPFLHHPEAPKRHTGANATLCVAPTRPCHAYALCVPSGAIEEDCGVQHCEFDLRAGECTSVSPHLGAPPPPPPPRTAVGHCALSQTVAGHHTLSQTVVRPHALSQPVTAAPGRPSCLPPFPERVEEEEALTVFSPWSELKRPPSTGEGEHEFRLYMLDGRLFLFDVGDRVHVVEYDAAGEAWVESAETKALARPFMNADGYAVAAGQVLYYFAANGACYAFDVPTREWRRAFDWRRLYRSFHLDQAPLALPRGGFLFLHTGHVCEGRLHVARYFGDGDAVVHTLVKAVGPLGLSRAVDRVRKDQKPNSLPNVGGSRWHRVCWALPEPPDQYTRCGDCWVEPFDERLYVVLYHYGQDLVGRVRVWHRSLKLVACADHPQDVYTELSAAAWTKAWQGEWDDSGPCNRPDTPCTARSTAPAPVHPRGHRFDAPPDSFTRDDAAH